MATLAERLSQPDMAALSDAEAAAALNAPDDALPTRRVDVATSDVRGALLATGEWPAIIMAAEPGSGAPSDVRGLCILVRDTLLHTQTIQATRSERYTATVAALTGLVAAALIAQTTADDLLALADVPQSWAEANGYPGGVTSRDVGLARGSVA